MIDVFTEYLRSLAPTGEPSDAALDRLWTELRRLLRKTLQRKGLWAHPPRYLGIVGHQQWETPETSNRRGYPRGARDARDALDELVHDFYVRMFLKQIRALLEYAKRGDSLVGLMWSCASQFLTPRQKENDPVGYQTFQRFKKAFEQAVENRRLFVLAGGAKIRNDTVFGFDPRVSTEPAPEEVLAAEAQVWNDELFFDWIAARSQRVQVLIDRLEVRILGLKSAGIEAFAFKTLVDAFKWDFRGRATALLGDGVEKTTSEDPLEPVVERQRIEALSDCVEEGIAAGHDQRRTKEKLLGLWRFLVDFALTAIDPEIARDASGALGAALRSERMPAHRQLSRCLDIRHDRIPTLLARLGEEVERCRMTLEQSQTRHEDSAGPAEADTLVASAEPRGSEVKLDETRDLRQELKRLTAEAYRRSAPETPSANGPEPGALYHLEGCPEPGIEWLVVDVAANSDCLVIPADSLFLLGSADVATRDDSPSGKLSLRCDLGVWLGPKALPDDRRTAGVTEVDLDRARARRRQLTRGVVAASEND